MRILHVTAHYPPDFTSGATLQVRRLAAGMAAAGHDVTVLAGSIHGGLADGAARDEHVDGLTVRWIGTAERVAQDDDRNWCNPHATAATGTLLDELGPSVLHAHTLQTLGADLLTEAAGRGVPTVVTMHDFWWWCPRLFLADVAMRPCPLDTRTSSCACARTAAWRHERAARLATVLDTVDAVLVPSAGVRDIVVANGLAADRVVIDPNDVDEHAVTAAPRRPAAPGPVRFLYVGGDQPMKGRDVLLAAADRLRRTHGRRGWTVTAYGVTNAPRRRPWTRGPVRLLPAYAPVDTAAVLAAADVLVIPSIARESFSLAAREALASGLAVVTSDCVGPEEVVTDGTNGLVVPTGDAEALARAMGRLIDDRGLLARLLSGARANPPPRRDPVEHAASLVDRYRALVRRPPP
jgi:glycosyltransferase involved in cell wall biosynthesis